MERVQKNVFRVILKEDYKSYDHALEILKIDDLSTRRKILLKKFAIGCITNEKTKKLFPLKKKTHNMKTRKVQKFKTTKAKTERMKKSTVPAIQKLLNNIDT